MLLGSQSESSELTADHVRAGLRADIEAFNRGKRSVTLDLRNPESKEIIHRLLVILIRTLL